MNNPFDSIYDLDTVSFYNDLMDLIHFCIIHKMFLFDAASPFSMNFLNDEHPRCYDIKHKDTED